MVPLSLWFRVIKGQLCKNCENLCGIEFNEERFLLENFSSRADICRDSWVKLNFGRRSATLGRALPQWRKTLDTFVRELIIQIGGKTSLLNFFFNWNAITFLVCWHIWTWMRVRWIENANRAGYIYTLLTMSITARHEPLKKVPKNDIYDWLQPICETVQT